LSCFLLFLLPILPAIFFSQRNNANKKEERRSIIGLLLVFYIRVLVGYFVLVPSFFSLFSYDLPPFLATLVFVLLLADANPFLLDFFLVAIIS
jgi:hypothetical protein